MRKKKAEYFNFWNPFERVAGYSALMLGIAGLLVSVFMASMFNARFDGVLNTHFVANSRFLTVLTDQLINSLSLCLCFYLLAMLLSLGKVRLIDILGTTLLAMSPTAILPLVNIGGHWSDLAVEISDKPDMTARVLSNLEPGLMIITVLVAILAMLWHIIWLYNGYKVSSGFKSVRLNISFILAMVGAMFLSRYLISLCTQISVL